MRMSLSGRIFVGLFAGVFTGLFFGELVADLKIFGDIFVKMLQITVLPYIVVSLIAGFGRMDTDQAKRLAIRGTAVLLTIWLLALVMIFIAALAFPDLDTASFFGSTVSPAPRGGDLLDLYLPANVFYSLSHNMVPAVVFFSILLGVALISVEDKSSVLPIFDGLTVALSKINAAFVSLTPYGIFAIAAAAAGTMTVDELARVQVYLVTYVALATLVTFWIFPGLVAALSGISYTEVLSTFKDTLVMAFATGNQFVVLPQIAANCKTLLARHNYNSHESESAIDIIVPVSFNFPSLGKLLVILFVLFAAWFNDIDLSVTDSVSLAFNGLFSLFGSINVAVPYMLDMLHVPADMFQLFLVTGIVVGRFGAMLAALHIIVLSVIGTIALAGGIKLHFRPIATYLGITAVLLFALVLSLRGYFMVFVPDSPAREEVLADIRLMIDRPSAKVSRTIPVLDNTVMRGSRLDHVLASGVLHVGYRANNLPCSFITPEGELVGFDVEMAYALAEDLSVDLEFLPFEFDKLGSMLASGQIDMAMSCIASLPDRYAYASFSRPYLDLTLAFVVKDHHRDFFAQMDQLREEGELKIALVSSEYFKSKVKRLLPNAKFVYLEAAEDFFDGHGQGADALLLTAEEGAAYAYRYPQFTVVAVKYGKIRTPAAYAVPKGDTEMNEFVSNWVDLKKKEGTVDALYTYWMGGGIAKRKAPRWSIVRDVLHWVE